MNEADLLIVIGASFSNHTGITPKKPIVQIDFDPMALAKFHKIDLPVFGEISETMKYLLKSKDNFISDKIDQRPEIQDRWKIWREEKARRLKEDNHQGVSSITIFDSISKHRKDDAIVCVDVGNNAYSLGRYLECRSQTFLMSGYLGSIGFALPVSMGAWATDLVNPDFSGIAISCGAYGDKITKNEEVLLAVQKLLEQKGPGLLEIETDVSLI
jgi:thiamine pyrophosphate-dependent acetolactate synthase large subunit-like protein